MMAWAAAVLEVGSSGSDVTKIQKKLIQYGYMTGAADGRYGEKTRDAVRWFQRKNGLTADGRVGPATAAALGVTLSGSSSSSSKAASSSSTIISADHRPSHDRAVICQPFAQENLVFIRIWLIELAGRIRARNQNQILRTNAPIEQIARLFLL